MATVLISDQAMIEGVGVIVGSMETEEPLTAERQSLSQNSAMKQRKAVKRTNEIVAECPLDCVCSLKIDGSKQWRHCGHYQGSTSTRKGCWVVCSYTEQ